MDDWYAKLVRRMTTPSFVIDNNACPDATIMKLLRVEAMNKQGILLGVVQVFADLNLIIVKANMSFDGEWFMDVFHVTDSEGKKVVDPEIVRKIEENIASHSSCPAAAPEQSLACIELTGADRPGLLSDLCAVLRDMGLNVVDAEVWTHKARAAAVLRVGGEPASGDPAMLAAVRDLLSNILRGDGESCTAHICAPAANTHRERRLHQLMHAELDISAGEDLTGAGEDDSGGTHVGVSFCQEKDYTVVTVRSKDRPKLLFDTLCALSDMQYLVFHGTVLARGDKEAWQEYYIRHEDGRGLRSPEERRRVARCLAAAIGRRTADGLAVELQTDDRVGLLSDITRVFRENGLAIRSAQISTVGGRAVDTFYVSDMSGGAGDLKTVDFACRQIGQLGKAVVRLKTGGAGQPTKNEAESTGFLLGNLLRACSFQSFRPIRSYS